MQRLNTPLPTLHVDPVAIALQQYRPITLADLWPLHTACYADRPAPKFADHFRQMCHWQQNGRCCWLIAQEQNNIVGSGQLILYPHITEITNLFVVPTHRNRGIGTQLITHLTAVARQNQLYHLEISVLAHNHNALRLYKQLQFIEKRAVTLTNGDTAITLYKKLQPASEHPAQQEATSIL